MRRNHCRVILLFTVWLLTLKPLALSHDIPVLGTAVYQPQIVATPDGGFLLVWTARSENSFDLFARRTEGDGFFEPVQLNASSAPLNTIPIDEMRPAVAVGPDERVAVAWTDDNFDIQVAISFDGGRSFGLPLQLNQDDGDALQEFPDITFGPDGVLHAVWLDPRIAEDGFEEPADIYYARVLNGSVTETNLTASQESSVCGCCLPDINVRSDGSLVVTFRNTTDTGYRDPFRIVGTADGEFGNPEPVSPPIWQIELCPVAGPIAVDGTTLWFDGSTGRRRLLSATDSSRQPAVILEDSDSSFLDYPPRRVSGTESRTPMLLVPAAPSAYLLGRQGSGWRILADDLPGWATSAAIHDGQLVMLGIDGVELRSEVRGFDSN